MGKEFGISPGSFFFYLHKSFGNDSAKVSEKVAHVSI